MAGSRAAPATAAGGGPVRLRSDMPYSCIESATAAATGKSRQLDALLAAIPCSPMSSHGSPTKEALLDGPLPDGPAPGPTTKSAVACLSPSAMGTTSHSVAVVEFETEEVEEAARTKATQPVLPPVKEDGSPEAHDGIAGGGGWVGTIGGEAVAVSVCSDSPDQSENGGKNAGVVGPRASVNTRPIPRAIDIRKKLFEEEPDADLSLGLGLGQKLHQDVEELSVGLSVLEDVDTIASVMTKDDAKSLAQRLGKLERRLLDVAGEPDRMDAVRALAKATQEQSKRAAAAENKVRKQKKKISTLRDLCQRLGDGRKRDHEARNTMKQEMEELRASNSELVLDLCRKEARQEELEAKLAQMQRDAQKLALPANQTLSAKMQSKYERLREEARRRVDEDAATIRNLQSKMAAMAEVHARKEKRSRDKIKILLEMRAAMEEQIRLLEGDDDSLA